MAASQEEPTLTRPEEENDDDVAKEEDTGAHVAPIIKLEEVAVTTGEEGEDALLDMKSKLYRFDKDGNQWKERGVGTVKILKHKETAKEHAGSDKSWVWHATDFSDGELKDELFCIRLGSVESPKYSSHVLPGFGRPNPQAVGRTLSEPIGYQIRTQIPDELDWELGFTGKNLIP